MLETAARGRTRPREGTDGIFGPEWFQWRGATLCVALLDEPPFIARLDNVGWAGGAMPLTLHTATVTVLDAKGQPQEVRELQWPPEGEVRVVRAP